MLLAPIKIWQQPTTKSNLDMTIQEAELLVQGNLEQLRSRAGTLNAEFGQADNSPWISRASKKQLLAEIIRLYANNHKAGGVRK